MLLVISPAKKLDTDSPAHVTKSTQPVLLDDAEQLIRELKPLAPQDVSELMHISDKLGLLNYDRYQQWQRPFTKDNAKQAVLSFKGDVYVGLDAESLNPTELTFAQKHLAILSGLYGVLRPLDLMQAYRLEMGTRFANSRGKDLYTFWGDKIAARLNKQLQGHENQTIINLASNEYFKAVDKSTLKANIITPIFKDEKNGVYKIISFYAKKARGMMAAYAIKNQLEDPEALKGFDTAGYQYQPSQSSDTEWVFTREEQ
ncbi:peroxide stress protein YaaA [Eionea flava]